MTDRSTFGFDSTTSDVLDGIDLTGRTVLITGGTSGLGAESARAMSAAGADVIITARNADKAAPVVESISNSTGKTVAVEELELGSLASIRDFGERVNAREGKIDIVITNAGVMACPFTKTEDGFEQQFGANHLGHFTAVNLIVPSLADNARVVSLSSSGHQFSPVVFEDIGFENREYHHWASYGQAKTANALFAVGLNARLKARGIESFAVHPGVIMTELGRHLPEEDQKMFMDMIESGELKMKSVEQGAATQVFAATAPELAGKGGSFLADCNICPVDDALEEQTVVRSYAVDPALADRLWAISEEMVGQSFAH